MQANHCQSDRLFIEGHWVVSGRVHYHRAEHTAISSLAPQRFLTPHDSVTLAKDIKDIWDYGMGQEYNYTYKTVDGTWGGHSYGENRQKGPVPIKFSNKFKPAGDPTQLLGSALNINNANALSDTQFSTNCVSMGGSYERVGLDGSIECCSSDYCYACNLDNKPPTCIKVYTEKNNPDGDKFILLSSPEQQMDTNESNGTILKGSTPTKKR